MQQEADRRQSGEISSEARKRLLTSRKTIKLSAANDCGK
jgi:hypothetical protein